LLVLMKALLLQQLSGRKQAQRWHLWLPVQVRCCQQLHQHLQIQARNSSVTIHFFA
jgi:hypothetical protein